jgi:hypothetical protein
MGYKLSIHTIDIISKGVDGFKDIKAKYYSIEIYITGQKFPPIG